MVIYIIGKPKTRAELETIWDHEEIVFVDSVEEYRKDQEDRAARDRLIAHGHKCICIGPEPGKVLCPCQENVLALEQRNRELHQAKVLRDPPVRKVPAPTNPFGDLAPPKNKIPKGARTFKEWNERGYRVLAGERSQHRNADGTALFTRKQVISVDEFARRREKDLAHDKPLNRF